MFVSTWLMVSILRALLGYEDFDEPSYSEYVSPIEFLGVAFAGVKRKVAVGTLGRVQNQKQQ